MLARRSLSVLATLAMLWALLPITPTFSTPRTAVDAPDIRADIAGSCAGGMLSYTYHTNSSPNVSRSGIAADIDINPGGFDHCTTAAGYDPDGPASFIELRPRSWYIDGTPSNSAIRLGIVECRDGTGVALGICRGDEQPRYFWAAGGCSGYSVGLTSWIDLGAADAGVHHYEIYYTGNGWIKGTIDGAQKFLFDDDSYPRTGCWTDGSEVVAVGWAAEREDIGDSVGTGGGAELKHTDARYGLLGQGWFSPSFITGNCVHIYGTDEDCIVSGSDNMTVDDNS